MLETRALPAWASLAVTVPGPPDSWLKAACSVPRPNATMSSLSDFGLHVKLCRCSHVLPWPTCVRPRQALEIGRTYIVYMRLGTTYNTDTLGTVVSSAVPGDVLTHLFPSTCLWVDSMAPFSRGTEARRPVSFPDERSSHQPCSSAPSQPGASPPWQSAQHGSQGCSRCVSSLPQPYFPSQSRDP